MRQMMTLRPLPGYRVAVAWRDGARTVVDFSRDIAAGGAWSAIAPPAVFEAATIVRDGRAVEWTDPAERDRVLVDIDADGLFELAIEQDPAVDAARQGVEERVRLAVDSAAE